uniref:Uncharacterized protein n=1 Tax=Anguilla anguilla TaxID=7936 RepID=A0A0E9QRW1_ANGAN
MGLLMKYSKIHREINRISRTRQRRSSSKSVAFS